MRFAFVGHVCIDRNLVRGALETFYGGGVVHAAVTARRLGGEVGVLTKCAAEDRERFSSFPNSNIEIRNKSPF